MNNSEKLIELVANTLGLAPSEIDENSGQENIPAWDSLAMVNLITELEILFSVQFDILEIAEFHSIKKIKSSLINKGVKF